ncbi:50S ribosomal protein L32 [Salpingoeca rosetta]|uniref:Large ribosomal subunit protein bL32m n=1 Tax=Salpingoeca rosetta (strain ATCC 50818 / BSB-021) TaxID=946362 RepID=F2U2E7_SALR5|nr:50S ribosomal protein L32 [Salpingoeca rosetta]EGD81799.1 50S ribosomal protein L32 [Salpingoeca rosetta]|eukprot:XP_004997003.1 50S ribosomal protein L32 [Salpingoeca rosetta]
MSSNVGGLVRQHLRSLRSVVASFFQPPTMPPLAPQLAPCAAPGLSLWGTHQAQDSEGLVAEHSSGDTSNPLSVFGTSIVLMAVPKRRTSHSKKRMRMTTKYLKNKSHYQKCKHCGELCMRHHICPGCIELWKKQNPQHSSESPNNQQDY